MEVHLNTEDMPGKCNLCFFASCTKTGLTKHMKIAHDNSNSSSATTPITISSTSIKPSITKSSSIQNIPSPSMKTNENMGNT